MSWPCELSIKRFHPNKIERYYTVENKEERQLVNNVAKVIKY